MTEYISKINLFNKNSQKLAGFDLDHTLVKPKSGRVRPKDKNDWMFYVNNLKERLLELQNDNYNIVIFTNQSGLEKNEQKRKDFLFKLNNVLFELGNELKISYFVLTAYNKYRKPMIGAYDLLLKEMKIDKKKSFYCGDAAGRPANWKYSYIDNNGEKCEEINKKKDFSASDLYFATNCGLKFYVPEEFFFDNHFKSDAIKLPKRNFLDYLKDKKFKDNFKLKLNEKKKYLIIMIGLPASGKSYLSHTIQKEYGKYKFEIVNKDLLKTKSKNDNLFKKLINDDANIIIDNTNLVKKDRDYYIKFLEKSGKRNEYEIIGINFTTNYDIINQLNYWRCYFTGRFIKSVVYNTLKKRMDIKGLLNEDFNKIINYDYKPVFKNKKEEKIFLMYY